MVQEASAPGRMRRGSVAMCQLPYDPRGVLHQADRAISVRWPPGRDVLSNVLYGNLHLRGGREQFRGLLRGQPIRIQRRGVCPSYAPPSTERVYRPEV